MKFKLFLLASLCLSLGSISMNAMEEQDTDGPVVNQYLEEELVEVSYKTHNPTLGAIITKILLNNKLLTAGICTSALLAMRNYNSTKQLINGLPLIKQGSHEAALISAISRGTKALCLTYIISKTLGYRPKHHLDDQLDDLFNKFGTMTLSALPSLIITKGKVQKDITRYLTITIMPKKFLRFILRFLPKTKTKIIKQINAIAKESGQAAALLSTIILYKLMTKIPGWMQVLYMKSIDIGGDLLLELLRPV